MLSLHVYNMPSASTISRPHLHAADRRYRLQTPFSFARGLADCCFLQCWDFTSDMPTGSTISRPRLLGACSVYRLQAAFICARVNVISGRRTARRSLLLSRAVCAQNPWVFREIFQIFPESQWILCRRCHGSIHWFSGSGCFPMFPIFAAPTNDRGICPARPSSQPFQRAFCASPKTTGGVNCCGQGRGVGGFRPGTTPPPLNSPKAQNATCPKQTAKNVHKKEHPY